MIRFLFAFATATGQRSSLTIDVLRCGDWNAEYTQAHAEAMEYADAINAVPTVLDWCYVGIHCTRIGRVDDNSMILATVPG